MSVPLKLAGRVFGRLTALHSEKRGRITGWVCRCRCGNETWVVTSHLTSNNTMSCGCFQRETSAKREFKHGHSGSRAAKASRLYNIWQAMLRRCHEPSADAYPWYGGRGITVCPEWHDFQTFLRDMGEAPPGTSIDRVDNNLGYSKANCRWASKIEQANNKCNSHRLVAFGKSQTLAQWSREIGMRPATLHYRIRTGWPPERALTEPVRVRAA